MDKKTLPKGHIQGKEDDLPSEEDDKRTVDDKLKEYNDWEPLNDKVTDIVYSESRKKYKCISHNTPLGTSSRVTVHLHKFHNINQDGTPYKEEPPKEPENDTIGPNEKALLESWGETIPEQEESLTGMEAFEIHKAEKARSIARVMENPYVTLALLQVKLLHLVPPTYDEGDIIREALQHYGESLGLTINIAHDPKRITDPNLREKIRISMRQWDEFLTGEEDS